MFRCRKDVLRLVHQKYCIRVQMHVSWYWEERVNKGNNISRCSSPQQCIPADSSPGYWRHRISSVGSESTQWFPLGHVPKTSDWGLPKKASWSEGWIHPADFFQHEQEASISSVRSCRHVFKSTVVHFAYLRAHGDCILGSDLFQNAPCSVPQCNTAAAAAKPKCPLA